MPRRLVSAMAAAGPMTLEEVVITAAAAVCVFVAVLVLVLRMSARRRPGPKKPSGYRDRRLTAMAASRRVRVPGGWEERAWSFGPSEEGEYGGPPGYGRPPGYGPPPLWTDSPYDPPGWRP